MKHYATLLLLIITISFHSNANAFAQGITIKVKDESLENVFKLIQKQSNYSFVYSGDQLKSASRVSLSVVNEPLTSVLDMLLKGQPLRYEISNEFVIIKKKQPATQAAFDGDTSVGKPIDLIGKVVDQDGKPVVGATVTVRGTGVSTATDVDGSFIIRAEEKGSIMVTSVGFETRIVRITGGNVLVKLTVAAQQMKEVIISTGYSKVSSEQFVGSYSRLDSATYNRMAGMNIINRLDGTVNGVFFNKKDNDKIQIRGLSTINSNTSPLIIVDNFPYPYDLNTINPNDVENIVVLKDAAATSIWGTRAGNGVIVITTKKAKFNQPLTLTFQSNITIQGKPNLFKSNSISSADFIEVEKFLFKNGFYESFLNDINRPIITPVVELLDMINKGLILEDKGLAEIDAMKQHDARNDLLKYVYQPKIHQQHNLGISGGNNILNYLFNFGYLRTGPSIKNTKGFDQYTINSSATVRPIRNLEISIGMGLSQSNDKSNSLPQYRMYPYMRLKDNDGNNAPTPNELRMGYIDTAGGNQLLDWHFRLLDEIKMASKNSESKFTNINIGISYKIFNWLNAQIKAQYSTSNQNTEVLYSEGTFQTRNLINKFTNLNSTVPAIRYPIPRGGILDVSNGEVTSKNVRGQVNMNHAWRTIHLFQGMLAFEASDLTSLGYSQGYYGYKTAIGTFGKDIDYYNYFPLYGRDEMNQIPNRSSISPQFFDRMVSFIGNFSYTYNNKITLYASGRRDGSNIFGVSTNNKWKPLWSVGTSWSIHNEGFYNIDWLSTLRLRASYGYSGNAVNNYSAYTTIAYGLFPAQFTGLNYATILNPPNPELKWEEVRMNNIGVDFAIKGNKLSGSIEFFQKRSQDLIGSLPLPPSSGTPSAPVNSASLKGSGLEFSLNSQLSNKQISWNAGLNISYSKIKVTEIFLPFLYKASDFVNFGINPAVGKIAYALSSYKWGGLDPNTGNPRGIMAGKESIDYNSIFNDTLGNQVLHGSAIPLINGNILNSVNWKQFTASVNISFKFNYYYRKPSINYENLFTGWAGVNEFEHRWQKAGDEKHTTVPSMLYPIPPELVRRDEFYRNSEINVLKGDHIRLQDFRLQYTPILKGPASTKELSIFIYFNNLNILLWKKDGSQYDPDFTGAAEMIIPPSKSITIGLNLSF